MTTYTNLAQLTPKQVVELIFGPADNNQENKMTDTVTPQLYSRKTFDVEGIQVTEDNMDAVASWTGGKVLAHAATETEPAKFFILVPVKRPLNERQKHAYAGDWVLKARSGFKVYTEKAMSGCFELKQEVSV